MKGNCIMASTKNSTFDEDVVVLNLSSNKAGKPDTSRTNKSVKMSTAVC